VFAVVLLGLPAGPVAPGEVRAATPDLTIVSTARYEVQPGDRRVRVTIDLTLTNRLKDTKTKRFTSTRRSWPSSRGHPDSSSRRPARAARPSG
jgi:hypothetical protein